MFNLRKLINQTIKMLSALTVLPTLPKILLMVKNANVTLVIILLGLMEVLVNVQDYVMLLEVLKQKTPKINVFVNLITLEQNAVQCVYGQTWEQDQTRIMPKPPLVLVKLISMMLSALLNAKPQKIEKLTLLKTDVFVKLLIGKLWIKKTFVQRIVPLG